MDFRFIVFRFSPKLKQINEKQNQRPFYRFSFFARTKTKKLKTKMGFRFIVFGFSPKPKQKNEKQKWTSVLSFFVFRPK